MRLGCSPRFPARRLGAGRPQPHPLPRPHILRASVRPAFPARDMAGSSEKAPDSGRGVVVNANSGFRASLARSPPRSSLRGTPPLPPPTPLAAMRSGGKRPRLCSSSGRRSPVSSHPGLPSPPGLTKPLLKSLLHPEFPVTPPFPPSPGFLAWKLAFSESPLQLATRSLACDLGLRKTPACSSSGPPI